MYINFDCFVFHSFYFHLTKKTIKHYAQRCPSGWTPNIRNRSPTQVDSQATLDRSEVLAREFPEASVSGNLGPER